MIDVNIIIPGSLVSPPLTHTPPPLISDKDTGREVRLSSTQPKLSPKSVLTQCKYTSIITWGSNQFFRAQFLMDRQSLNRPRKASCLAPRELNMDFCDLLGENPRINITLDVPFLRLFERCYFFMETKIIVYGWSSKTITLNLLFGISNAFCYVTEVPPSILF